VTDTESNAAPIELRCSSLPLALKCAGSVRPSAVEINPTNDQAELGTTTHKALAVLVRTGRVDWSSLPELARGQGFKLGELRALVAGGARLWWRVRDSFPDAEAEVPLVHRGPGYVLTGHVDVRSRMRRTATIADWKGGRLDSDYREQLLGYAALELFDDPELDDAAGGILWIRDQDFEPYSLRRNQLEAWEERLIKEVVQWNGTYRPGPHCTHCRRRHECPAANALARHDVAAIRDNDVDGLDLDKLTPQERIDLVVLAREVEKKAQRVVKRLRQAVIETGDVIGEEQRLTLQHDEERNVDVAKAWPILAESWGFGDAEAGQVLRLAISEAESIIRKRAPPRKGAAHVRELAAQLEAAGAVTTSTTTKLIVRRN
jgi:hypothetical protein